MEAVGLKRIYCRDLALASRAAGKHPLELVIAMSEKGVMRR